ncbi:orotidine-5'-phosphate decarboxylase [bacterium (candidate division B38) B3_B38]|nr:MAG: orotidine-5'-phosphate decarboxylase [bacterium (candidate division B38) B3_B38]
MEVPGKKIKDSLIIALDVPAADRALELVNLLRGKVGMFKVGSQLFTSAGPQLVQEIVSGGDNVFLDLKFHDIPRTVVNAAIEAVKMGVSMFNLHTMGGMEMMRLTVHETARYCSAFKLRRPKIVGVTVLTSLDQENLQRMGLKESVDEMVIRLSLLALEGGLDGVIASPREIRAIRGACGEGFIIVTPGIRPSWASADDQRRFSTPREAIEAGADYIVIGRPITGSKDPLLSLERILSELPPLQGGK